MDNRGQDCVEINRAVLLQEIYGNLPYKTTFMGGPNQGVPLFSSPTSPTLLVEAGGLLRRIGVSCRLAVKVPRSWIALHRGSDGRVRYVMTRHPSQLVCGAVMHCFGAWDLSTPKGHDAQMG